MMAACCNTGRDTVNIPLYGIKTNVIQANLETRIFGPFKPMDYSPACQGCFHGKSLPPSHCILKLACSCTARFHAGCLWVIGIDTFCNCISINDLQPWKRIAVAQGAFACAIGASIKHRQWLFLIINHA